MSKLNQISTLLLALFPATTQAEGNKVQFPSGDAAWTVEISYKDSQPGWSNDAATVNDGPASAGPPFMQKVEIARAGDRLRYQITWTTRRKSEAWLFSNVTLMEDVYSNEVLTFDGELGLRAIRKLDRTLFNWTDNRYPELVDYKGKKCFYYRDPNTSGGPTGETHGTESTQAWIDADTLRPVAFEDDQATYSFTFHSSPPGPLSLPAKFQREYERYQVPAVGKTEPSVTRR